MQCKDIPDEPILRFVHEINSTTGWASMLSISDGYVGKAMPDGVPYNLMLAKMRMMIRRGVMQGCACGCRGDFCVTEKGCSEIEEVMPDKGWMY